MIVVHSYIEALREDPSGASAGFPRAHVYQFEMVTRFTSRSYLTQISVYDLMEYKACASNLLILL